MRPVAISGLSGYTVFFYIISCSAWFSENNLLNLNFDFLYNYFSETFLSLRRIQPAAMTTVLRPSCEVPIVLVRSKNILKISQRYSKNSNIKFHENPVSWSRVPCRLTDWQTDRQTDRQGDRETDREIDRQTERQTGRQRDRQTDRKRDRQTDMTKLSIFEILRSG